jgi:hypothetical protein
MCFDDAINTADVGIGFPAPSTALTALAISDLVVHLKKRNTTLIG